MDLFTDRYSLIRSFTRALHEDGALGKILFFHGGGGNGKSLLLRFLQKHACKQFRYWDELSQLPDGKFVDRLQTDPSFDPLPVARLDFHTPPREFEQPTVDYDALLMLRHQLGTFNASGVARLRFPVYDFAAVWYLHQTRKLTEDRLRALFPEYEMKLVVSIANAVSGLPYFSIAEAVLNLFDRNLKERWTLFRQSRGVDRDLIEEIQAMDEEELVLEMPRLFALDLKAALAADDTPSRIVLLLDGHDAFATGGETVSLAPEGDRDQWLRYLLAALEFKDGIVPVVTGRREPRWPDQAPYTIPADYLEPCLVGHFSDVDADAYLQKALAPTGVDDPALRARLRDYARVAPDEVHPLYAGLGADVVLQAAHREYRLTADDFPEEPEAGKKPQLLVERLLKWADRDVEYAIRSLAAARAFDRALFEALGQRERNRYTANDAFFDTVTGFSFVWEEEGRGAG